MSDFKQWWSGIDAIPSDEERFARFVWQAARIKELESQLVSTDQLSVHDIRIGMSALLQCEVSEIEAMDNRCYDESYQAVQRVIEAISLSVKQEKLFGSEIYQAAENHFEQKIKELEQQLAKLAEVEKDAERYQAIKKNVEEVLVSPRTTHLDEYGLVDIRMKWQIKPTLISYTCVGENISFDEASDMLVAAIQESKKGSSKTMQGMGYRMTLTELSIKHGIAPENAREFLREWLDAQKVIAYSYDHKMINPQGPDKFIVRHKFDDKHYKRTDLIARPNMEDL